ncbi:type II CAAX endopeptidase family protein [Hyalangium versicolor]|uniref:type II CAAX endopeptidase family protein n=1 Tax=Hyalangium versicolor TaxID=2861190 RepID=UPI00281577F8|nr:type II CAAX endopeptidase family protein [Hyalangium versicolor]
MEDSTPNPLPEAVPPAPEPLPPTMSPLMVAAVTTALGLASFLTLGGVVQLLNAAFGIWFTEIFIFLAIPWVLLRLARYEPLGFTGVPSSGLAPAALGFGLGVANFFAFVVPIQFAAQSVAPQWLRDMFDGSRIFEGQNSLELVVMLAGVSLAAPVCEEFFFRGVFQKGLLATTLSRTSAVVITAVVFSAFHMDPVGFTARVELGLLFGALRLYTGSLWPGILAHSANNMVSSILFLSARQMGSEGADEEPELQSVILLMIVGLGAMGLLLSIARKVPAFWGPKEDPSPVTRSAPSLMRLALPWAVAATLSVGALVWLDNRGIRLSFVDMQYQLPKLPKDATDSQQQERRELLRLREDVRKGRMPIEAYEEERARQASKTSSESSPEKQ